MASPTQWTWVWVNSGSWWGTGRPGMLWFMGSQRVRHNWMTELNWTMCIDFYVNKGFHLSWVTRSRTAMSYVILCLSGINYVLNHWWASLVAQLVKNLPASARDLSLIPGLGRSSGKEMATHSSTLAGIIPWMEKPQRLQFMGGKESDTTKQLHFHI